MKVSFNWLQTYFKKPLPAPGKVVELFTFHSFEIEGVEKKVDDTLFDAKVLPDRAHYALSHRGVAYELAAILEQKRVIQDRPWPISFSLAVSVKVEDSVACPRYMARVVENINVSESPEWIKNRLESIGQRSINTIVDVANFVMFDIGQPLHIFDKDKVEGGITVRKARSGETMTTLDGKAVVLDESMLVIADDEAPLALAGVKGGTKAEVTTETKNIIIEAANFNAVLIRKTSTKTGIRNDASKRFENGITPELAKTGMHDVSVLISQLCPDAHFGDVVDMYPNPQKQQTISITQHFISAVLGVTISAGDITNILERLDIAVEKKGEEFILTIPSERLDLVIPEDIVEEIARIYGYDRITPALPKLLDKSALVNKLFYYSQKIRAVLVNLGYSEVYTYSLVDKGEVELENPLASDKGFMRSNLAGNIKKALEMNVRNADLLHLEAIKIFEIGTVFSKEGEHTAFAVGAKNVKKGLLSEPDEIKNTIVALIRELNIDISELGTITDNVFELNLDVLIPKLPEPTEHKIKIKSRNVKYQPVSAYPFSVRDIAVFVPEGIPETNVRTIIEKNAGALLVRNTLFDVFTKKTEDGTSKTSYAFRLVLQSNEKTLTEEDITGIMKAISDEMSKQEGWKVR